MVKIVVTLKNFRILELVSWGEEMRMKSAARRCVCIIGCVLMVVGVRAETPPAEVVTFDHWAYDALQILSDTQVSSWEPRPWGSNTAFTRYDFAELVAAVLRDMSSSSQDVADTPPRSSDIPPQLLQQLVESVPNIIATMVREFWPELATLDRPPPKLPMISGEELPAFSQGLVGLVANAGFEHHSFAAPAAYHEVIPGWFFYAIEAPAAMEVVSARAHDRYALLSGGHGLMHSAAFDVTAGQKYTATAWMRGTGHLDLGVLWWAACGDGHAEMATPHCEHMKVPAQAADEWQRISATYTAPEGATRAYLRLAVGGGEVHVDQVRIVEARTPRESLMNVPAGHWFHTQAQQLLREIATEVLPFDHWAYELGQKLYDAGVDLYTPHDRRSRPFTRYDFAELVAAMLRDMSSSSQDVGDTPPCLLHTPGYLSRCGLRGSADELVESVRNIIATMVREFWPELATLGRRSIGGRLVLHRDQVRIIEARTPRESLINVPAGHWFHAQAQQLLREIATDDNNVPARVR